jgi:tetratricopeptide (TPR) repeat protein
MVTHLLNNTDPAINAYMIPTVLHQHMLARINLVRNIPGWGYRYRHHETIELKGQAPSYVPMGNPTSPEAGPYVFTQHDGARSHDPAKFERDLASLREAWQEDGAPRYLFFLALTMANGKHPQEARHTFKLFIEYSKDPCEVGMVYYALLMLGRLNQSVLDCSYDPMLDLEKAYRLCPTRAEALGEIALLHGKRQEWEKAYVYALAAMQPVMPEHLEFLEPMWVQWRALDILTVCLINLGRYVEAVGYLNALLKRPALPARERPRVQEHLTNITRRPQP